MTVRSATFPQIPVVLTTFHHFVERHGLIFCGVIARVPGLRILRFLTSVNDLVFIDATDSFRIVAEVIGARFC